MESCPLTYLLAQRKCFFSLAAGFLLATQAGAWQMKTAPFGMTQWASQIDTNNPLPEYPRPQLVRTNWVSLNGIWQFQAGATNDPVPAGQTLTNQILVPYPMESAISGVMQYSPWSWYRRTFTVPSGWTGKRIILHLDAVNWQSKVYINGQSVGTHKGGYDPFSYDITGNLTNTGPQELIVQVYSPQDSGGQPRGKQSLNPDHYLYTTASGIWQTVWLEPVDSSGVRELVIVPDVDNSRLLLTVNTYSTSGVTVAATVLNGGTALNTVTGAPQTQLIIPITNPKLWSPNNPFLYGLQVSVTQSGITNDSVSSYFGMRKISMTQVNGIQQLQLNNQFLFHMGPLDQGYWPDGIYTAPTDAALAYDLQQEKALGFNTVRKHIKVESQRWYYWADTLGLMVWQDMPSCDTFMYGGTNEPAIDAVQFIGELKSMVTNHWNSPSIIMWVLFNEGQGQSNGQTNTPYLTQMVKTLDPSRLVNAASGWNNPGVGDLNDLHQYPDPAPPASTPTRAPVDGEYGGIDATDSTTIGSLYDSYIRQAVWYKLAINGGLNGAIYTQITDVENERNGLLTYTRQLLKPDANAISAANQRAISGTAIPAYVLLTSQQQGQTWKYNTNTTTAATNWFAPTFNDSGWISKPGGFGTIGGNNRTTWNSSDIWLRQQFNPGNLTSNILTNLLFQCFHDEDCEIYLNGVLAGSFGGYNSSYQFFSVNTAGKNALVANATNLIAVHCRQTGGGQYIDVGIIAWTIVLPGGSLANSPVTSLTTNSAALNATLTCSGTNYAVYAYWNKVNGGTNPAAWTNSAYVGSWTNVAATNLSYTATGLAPGTTYYFTFRGTNTTSDVWAANVQSFTTLPLPAPVVDNGGGATNLSVGVAQLRGTLANGPSDVRLYWGATDGGTNPASWANVILQTGIATGSFASNASNLTYGVTYFYRSHASNQWGTAWAAGTTNFTTLRPASSLTNASATGITISTAVLKATLVCTGAVYNVVAYWNTLSGGTNAATWTNSAFVGAFTNVSGSNLSFTATGLAPNTTCYFTFRATNALDSLWATNVQSFTTLTPPAPTVDNAAGATNTVVSVAALWGTLANGPADVRLYWGTTDGGTNKASWANTILLSGTANGAFSGNASGLIYGLTYFYRAYASNQWGTAWSPAPASFTSLKPLGASAGVIPYTSMVAVSASEETPGYEVTNVFNGNGMLGDSNTHTASGEWLSAGNQPVASQWVKVRFDQTYALDYLRVWAFAESADICVTNADVYVLNQANDPGTNAHLSGGPFNATGWTLALPQQGFTSSPGGNITNTDPHINLGGVMARQLAFKINATVTDLGVAGFSEIQIYRFAPTPITLTNAAATSVTANSAGLNGALASAGAAYDVFACWNTMNGGTNVAQWTNTAYVGSYNDVPSTNLSYTAPGLAPSTTYYFTFRATNAVEVLWATNVQSFTTLAGGGPPVPLLPRSAITVTGGVPSFTFATVSGFKYRLVYKNALTSATWQPVIAAPNFPLPDGWSVVSTGSPMSLTDTNTVGQPQRFYRLEAANP